MMFACCGARDDKHVRTLKVNTVEAKLVASSDKTDLPKEVDENKVWVKVDFATITYHDKEGLKGKGAIGQTFSGEVKKVGTKVTTVKKNDKVYGIHEGSVAEWVIVPASQLSVIPSGIPENTASALPVLASWAVHADKTIKENQKVFVSSTNQMVNEVIQKIAVAKKAKFVTDKADKEVAFYYHLGGPVEAAFEAIEGISFQEDKGSRKHHLINVATDFAANSKFVTDNAAKYFAGVKPSVVIGDKAKLEESVNDIVSGKAAIVVIDVTVLEKIESKPVVAPKPATTTTTTTTTGAQGTTTTGTPGTTTTGAQGTTTGTH